MFMMRLTPSEFAELEKLSSDAGMSKVAYVRFMLRCAARPAMIVKSLEDDDGDPGGTNPLFRPHPD